MDVDDQNHLPKYESVILVYSSKDLGNYRCLGMTVNVVGGLYHSSVEIYHQSNLIWMCVCKHFIFTVPLYNKIS